jgi:hypothetical protein
MAEDNEASVANRQMLVISKPRRTMWVSMIGTITQTPEGKSFEGVRRYPELDNPVWFASEDDLDVIFEKDKKSNQSRVTIGKSPIFTDYEVSIDIDKFFGKHAAILGNTGSGKSCTVTAVMRAVLDRGMPNAHFIIFDTNNEYEQAFTKDDGSRLYDRSVLRNDGDHPSGLWVPHWFMNSLDYHAFFRPGEGAQAPLLFTAISVARATGQVKASQLHLFSTIHAQPDRHCPQKSADRQSSLLGTEEHAGTPGQSAAEARGQHEGHVRSSWDDRELERLRRRFRGNGRSLPRRRPHRRTRQ